MSTDQPANARRIRPEWRPFVGRPVVLATIPASLLAAATYFFWHPLESALGSYVLVGPAVAALLLVVTFLARMIRYTKTRYEIRPGRIIVETGTLFRERTVELDVENITLVEWQSPFFLRTLYGVGHVTVHEAGSASDSARLGYIAEADRTYARIGEHMSARGFSMQRQRRIQEETPGHLGALVDLTAELVELFWAVGLFGLSFLPDLWPLLVGDGASLVQLVAGNQGVFSETLGPDVFPRVRAGVIVVGGTCVSLAGGWLTMRYLDLVHRNYTLYNDVIDYIDGVLNENHKFIPLENLADTQLSRPLHKRFLGLSDVTLSSQGAENAIAFRSTPEGPGFARAIDDLVHRPVDRGGRADEPEQTEAPEHDREVGAESEGAFELSPDPARAMLGSIAVGFLLLVPLVLTLVFPLLAGWNERITLGLLTVSTVATGLLVAGGLTVAAGLASGGLALVRAWAFEFRFDDRGAHRIYDLISRDEKQFALERITSVSVYRNPLDWFAGTMTLRFRSIGSDEDLDFWGVPKDSDLVDGIRAHLDLGAAPSGKLDGALTPAYTLSDGLKARGPIYVLMAALLAPIPAVVAMVGFPAGRAMPAVFAALFGLVLLGHQLWRRIVHGRIRGTLFDDHLELTGGIIRHYRHIAPLEHVRAVQSRRYPGSDAGRLTLKTAGFPVATDHLADVVDLHHRVDARLAAMDGTAPPTRSEPGTEQPSFRPSAATELLRHTLWLLIAVGLVVMPYVFLYYRRVLYTVENGRLVADAGLYFAHRTTILFGRVDHIESNRKAVQYLTSTRNIQVYTVGSRECDLVLRSLSQSSGALEQIRERLAFGDD